MGNHPSKGIGVIPVTRELGDTYTLTGTSQDKEEEEEEEEMKQDTYNKELCSTLHGQDSMLYIYIYMYTYNYKCYPNVEILVEKKLARSTGIGQLFVKVGDQPDQL